MVFRKKKKIDPVEFEEEEEVEEEEEQEEESIKLPKLPKPEKASTVTREEVTDMIQGNLARTSELVRYLGRLK